MRFLCIHGHFYQPPRENPWLEEVEVEDSAAPFHDWNAKIAAESYAPNAFSRILGPDQRIAEIVDNYLKISFNFGPTLLWWLQKHRNDIYQQIVEADRSSLRERRGHGNALAQCYSHPIMPLALHRDKVTQVRWGITDFEWRFRRQPEGMWLPETAVDISTLEVLAEQGIKFTILAPHQAQAVRPFKKDWVDVSGAKIGPTRAYRCTLRRSLAIDLFFYNGPISNDISFGGLLGNGDRFVDRLLGGFDADRKDAQLMHVATDGETFGHHHRFGDMALAYAIKKIEQERLARLTNYGEYLELHPPEQEVKIYENTSWSCAHGIERWRGNCGCQTGNPSYHQLWRAPLRESLNDLKENLDILYEREAAALLKDPWEARDKYIEVILDRSAENREAFLAAHARCSLTISNKVKIWKLLELQRHALLMFTSCGWFFNDLTNIETVKVLEYAARSIHLAREVAGVDLEPKLVASLQKAPGNKPQFSDGAKVYEELVRPAAADLKKSLAHYAISSLVENYAPLQKIFCFEFDRNEYSREEAGLRTLAVGAVTVRSAVTQEELDGIFAVLHLGGYDFHCVVTDRHPLKEFREINQKLLHSFAEGSTVNLLKIMDSVLGGETFAFRDLFTEERRKIGRLLLKDAIERARGHYQQIYEESREIVLLLVDLKIPMPEALRIAAKYVLSLRLRQAATKLNDNAISRFELREVVAAVFREEAAEEYKVNLSELKEALERSAFSKLMVYKAGGDEAAAEDASDFLGIAQDFRIDLDLWRLQNLFWELLNHEVKTSEKGLAASIQLGTRLGFSTAVVQEKLAKPIPSRRE